MLFIFGLLGGGATTLGLAAPLINDGLSVLFGFPSTTFSQIVVLLIVLQFLPIRPLLVWKKAFKCSVTLTFGARCYCLPLFWPVVAQLDAKTLEKQDKLQEAKDAKTTFDELVEKLRQEEIQ